MNKNSTERLSKVMPELARRVRVMIAALEKRGRAVEVVQGLRTFPEQQALWEQGRLRKGPKVTNAKAGQSFHNYGLAVDLCPFKDGVPDWNDAAGFRWIGEEARRVQLEWGGDWKRAPDRPHVELSPLPVIRCFELHRGGGLAAVWSEVERMLPK